jgi:hypothetical protein
MSDGSGVDLMAYRGMDWPSADLQPDLQDCIPYIVTLNEQWISNSSSCLEIGLQ